MRDTILCLCDLTGVMARPWVEHGYQAVLVDPQHGCDHEDGAYLKLACTIEEGRAAYQAWHRSKAATPEYTARLLGVPLDEVLYIIAHPETPAPHKDDFTPEFIESLI